MTIIIPLFAAAFLVGYLLYWLKTSETRGTAGLHDEMEHLRSELEHLEHRVESLEAIVVDEEPRIMDDQMKSSDAEVSNRGRRRSRNR